MSATADERQMPSASENFQELLKKHGNRCQSCGIEDVPLGIAHIVSIAKGGSPELDNLALLCRNCHHLLDSFRPSGLEFERFLLDILVGSPHYTDVVPESQLSTRTGTLLWADFAFTRLLNGNHERMIMEAKVWSSPRRGQVQSAIERIGQYRDVASVDAAALAFTGRLAEDDTAALQAADIEIWDLDHVAMEFAKTIEAQPFSGLKLLYSLVAHSGRNKGPDALIAQLKGCKPGTIDWRKYQEIITNALEFLFTPPLMPPILESSDLLKANRRDIILPNYAAEGFWKSLRETYNAHYIVVDAKNYKGKITKPQALQIANYLKPHGTGMFGIIATRSGASPACLHTIAEQWALYQKMVIVLSDDDIERMLTAAGSAGKPEDIIEDIIQKFRLSM